MHSASGNSENLRRQSGRLVSSAKRVLRCEARYGPTGVVGYVGLLITSDSLAQSLGLKISDLMLVALRYLWA